MKKTKQTVRNTAEETLADILSGKLAYAALRTYIQPRSGLSASRRNMYSQAIVLYKMHVLEQKLKELQEEAKQ